MNPAVGYVLAALVGGVFMAGRDVVGWLRNRGRDDAVERENESQSAVNASQATLNRISITDRLVQQVGELHAQIDERDAAYRQELDKRDAAHARELAIRDATINGQAITLQQQATEIAGLKQQIAILQETLLDWKATATEARDTLRTTLITAVQPKPADGGGE